MSMYFPKMSPTQASEAFSSMTQPRTPRAPQPRAASKSATGRMPAIPTLPVSATGTKKPQTELNPIAPVPPQSPWVTQSPYLDSLRTESNRRGQLSTLLGRDTTLPTQANRNARLSGYLS